MSNNKDTIQDNPREHFIKRARKYNQSSNWVDDSVLIRKMCDLAKVGPQACVLDIAIGTGKIAQSFYGQVKHVVGIDICKEMARQAKECANGIILAPAENLPFKNGIFDACVCRQGLQFVDLDDVLSEIYRVLKPGGHIVLCHLTAYGKEDKDETFLIQRLRNPARRNFFLPEDFIQLIQKQAFTDMEFSEYLSRESVNRWIDNGAIIKEARTRIKEIYKNSSSDFRRIHNIQFENGDIFDTMKMFLVKAVKKGDE